MPFEKSFNSDFAKTLAKSDNPEKTLNERLDKMKSRMLELNQAREKSVSRERTSRVILIRGPACPRGGPRCARQKARACSR